MLQNFQTTIARPASCYGIGVHLGHKTHLNLKPAKPNTGIIFVRNDVKNVDNVILASYKNVCNTDMSTSISNNANIKVSTIEHLMAALWGCGIDNVIVELDGPEVPIMDGSSMPFVFLINCAGVRLLDVKRKYLRVLKEVSVFFENGSSVILDPSNNLANDSKINLSINFENKAIGKQNFVFDCDTNYMENFQSHIANARTFGFASELEYLKSKGLANGVSLDNTIGIDKNGIMNLEGLRHNDEFVRHKMLDLMGDLYTSSSNVIANISGQKTSHAINNALMHKLFSDKSNYTFETY